MTLHEAEAFVGAERCIMKTLTETDLYCEPPEVQPPPKRRQKRDTTHNLPEFIVRAVEPVQLGRGRPDAGQFPGALVEPHLALLSLPCPAGEVWLPRVGAGPRGVRHEGERRAAQPNPAAGHRAHGGGHCRVCLLLLVSPSGHTPSTPHKL